MAKFYQEISNILVCSCWASSSKTRERNNTRDIRACVHSPVPENGNGEIKIKREFVQNGPFRSSPVQLPFNSRSPPVFFKRAPVEQIVRGNFFLTPTILQDCYIQMTTATLFGLCIRTSHTAGYRRARAGTRNRLLSLYGLNSEK